MNRKISFLAAGLALSAALTGCTSTAGYRTIPGTTPGLTDFDPIGIHDGRLNGPELNRRNTTGAVNRNTDNSVTRGQTGAVKRRTAGVGTGFIGADGRWHPYTGSSVRLPNAANGRNATFPGMF